MSAFQRPGALRNLPPGGISEGNATTQEDELEHNGNRASWGMAVQATLHCLTGCAIGEVLGMVLGTSFGLHNAATVVLSIALAFLFGYGLTCGVSSAQGCRSTGQ